MLTQKGIVSTSDSLCAERTKSWHNEIGLFFALSYVERTVS